MHGGVMRVVRLPIAYCVTRDPDNLKTAGVCLVSIFFFPFWGRDGLDRGACDHHFDLPATFNSPKTPKTPKNCRHGPLRRKKTRRGATLGAPVPTP